MSDPLAEGDDEASTPLRDEERRELIPDYITSRAELNEAEQAGISEAARWAFSRKRDVTREDFLLDLHKRMFKTVWKWAGAYRATERNIGVKPHMIAQDLKVLLDDVKVWIEHKVYPPDEIAVRFHHRLVLIHPFPNGNGRWSRLAADLLIVQLAGERFTWGGQGDIASTPDLRKRYVEALKTADGHDITALLEFARS
jgi:Fic-DOC domain mobile mystery protein B